MQIARIGIEQRELFLRGARHARVAVPHQRHIVVYIEIRAPRIVVEILHPATHDFQRPLVGNAEIVPQQRAPLLQRFLKIHLL